MKIALDYDGTYTRDPMFWATFINLASACGVDVRVVTHRHHEHDRITNVPNGIRIMYTDGIAKQWYCEHREDFWTPDVWIDDKPRGILENGPLSMEQIAEWRATREV